MAEVKLNKMRGDVLTAASNNSGVTEDRWTYDRAGETALRYLVKQKCLKREIGDSAKAFQYRLFITDRGRKLLAGDYVEEVEDKKETVVIR